MWHITLQDAPWKRDASWGPCNVIMCDTQDFFPNSPFSSQNYETELGVGRRSASDFAGSQPEVSFKAQNPAYRRQSAGKNTIPSYTPTVRFNCSHRPSVKPMYISLDLSRKSRIKIIRISSDPRHPCRCGLRHRDIPRHLAASGRQTDGGADFDGVQRRN